MNNIRVLITKSNKQIHIYSLLCYLYLLIPIWFTNQHVSSQKRKKKGHRFFFDKFPEKIYVASRKRVASCSARGSFGGSE